MIRYALFLCSLFFQTLLTAQSIVWTSACANRTVCLNLNQCSMGHGVLTESATTSCQINSLLSFSYKLDLNSDGSTDVQAAEDTLDRDFPLGVHRVTWRVNDNCGNARTCSYSITVKDCQPPNLLCINGLTQQINPPDCSVTFNASQFILSLSDNCTPKAQIQIGLREEGTGAGFPAQTSITFDRCHQGFHGLEVWAKDANGLTNISSTYVLVQEAGTECKCITDADIGLKGCVRTSANRKVNDYWLRGKVESVTGAPTAILKTFKAPTADSCYNIVAAAKLPIGQTYRVTLRGERDGSYLNGVSTYDLVLISKHILGLEPFSTIYQALAADANRSNSVTTFDIVEFRKLILGIYDTLPDAKSWRFVRPLADPGNYTMLDVAKDTFQIIVPAIPDDVTLPKLDFIALKMGDLNNSAISSLQSDAEDRTETPPVLLSADDRVLEAGEMAVIPLHWAADAVLNGWQLALATDPALARIEGMEALPDELWHLLPDGSVRALWQSGAPARFVSTDLVCSVKIRALQKTTLSECLHLQTGALHAEAYGIQGERQPIQLKFRENREAPATFFPPRPNPTSGETSLGLLLPETTEVHLELFDIAGRRIWEHTAIASTGYHAWDIPTSALPIKGVYLYRLQAGHFETSGRLLRL